jgi:nucleoside-diphosphate-sugar epimerase
VCTYGVDYDWLPVTEDHPLRPITEYGSNKVAADEVFLEAFRAEQFPATVVKPSTTYGPQMGLVRQIAWDYSWLGRILEGRPILICGDGHAMLQHLHVDDAALCFAHMLGRSQCVGKTYNMVFEHFTSWKRHHETAMKVLGREVELVGLSCNDLERFDVPGIRICRNIFSHNCYYSGEKLVRDVPEFQPRISLEEGMRRVHASLQEEDRIPPSEPGGWEDTVIERARSMHGQGS